MALYIPQSILHLARSLYVRPETYGPTYLYFVFKGLKENYSFVFLELYVNHTPSYTASGFLTTGGDFITAFLKDRSCFVVRIY